MECDSCPVPFFFGPPRAVEGRRHSDNLVIHAASRQTTLIPLGQWIRDGPMAWMADASNLSINCLGPTGDPGVVLALRHLCLGIIPVLLRIETSTRCDSRGDFGSEL